MQFIIFSVLILLIIIGAYGTLHFWTRYNRWKKKYFVDKYGHYCMEAAKGQIPKFVKYKSEENDKIIVLCSCGKVLESSVLKKK